MKAKLILWFIIYAKIYGVSTWKHADYLDFEISDDVTIKYRSLPKILHKLYNINYIKSPSIYLLLYIIRVK